MRKVRQEASFKFFSGGGVFDCCSGKSESEKSEKSEKGEKSEKTEKSEKVR